jgi:predicted peptidase
MKNMARRQLITTFAASSETEKKVKRYFAILGLLLTFAVAARSLSGQSSPAGSAESNRHIKSITAITEVFGDGQKITAAAIEYDKDLDSQKLGASTFSVADRTITKVYANTTAARASHGANGRYAIVELSTSDGAASIIPQMGGMGGPGGPGGRPQGGSAGPGGPPQGLGGPPPGGFSGPKRRPVKVSVTQTGDVVTAGGEKYLPLHDAIESNRAINLIVDDFKQLVFHDSENGNDIKYNLYIPKNYDPKKSYPMVLFMHDASVDSDEADRTLIQGLGAVVWASPEEQAKHPAFVLAPQIKGSTSQNETTITPLGESIYHLVKYLPTQYSIDQDRLYTTGQSAGCMLSIGFNIAHPDLFAASLLVAGQWNAELTAPLIHQKLWIIVSEGDQRAFPGMNASIAIWEKEGAKITRGRWSARDPQDVQAANVAKMMAEHNNLMYTTYIKGTTLPPGQENSGAQEHMASWQFAYTIPTVRDWLFAQSKALAK